MESSSLFPISWLVESATGYDKQADPEEDQAGPLVIDLGKQADRYYEMHEMMGHLEVVAGSAMTLHSRDRLPWINPSIGRRLVALRKIEQRRTVGQFHLPASHKIWESPVREVLLPHYHRLEALA